MSDLAVAVVVKRTELALADLALEDASGGYQVVDFGAGAVTWRRQTATSPLVAGEQLVAAVKEQRTLSLAVRTKGPTSVSLNSRMQTMCRAFEQFSYELHITLDSVVFAYSCQPADYVPLDSADTVDKYGLMVKVQTTRFEISVHPSPLLGGI